MKLSDNAAGVAATEHIDRLGIPADAATGSPGNVLVIDCGGASNGVNVSQTLRGAGLRVKECTSSDVETVLTGALWDAVVIETSDSAAACDALITRLRLAPASARALIVVVGCSTVHDAGSGASGGSTDSDADARTDTDADDWIVLPIDPPALTRRILNLVELSRLRRPLRDAQSRMQHELSSRTKSLDALIETGMMMAMERDRSKLLRRLLDEGRRLLQCDGATMYMVTEEKTLRFELRTRDDPLPSMQIPLYDAVSGRPNENFVSVYSAVHNRSVRIDDVYQETRFDLSGTRSFDRSSGYRTVSMLTVPIAPRGGEAIGVLQFINAMEPSTGRIVPFPADVVGLVEALAAQAAVALDNLDLVESQKQLMESLIRVLATAIDAKSSYTGRHCERVPELAMKLAEAACNSAEKPFADFAFRNEEEWQEFRIGAWLHDCGKVAMPEYVIDKATKLETLHNRIHEVRMRFEVLLRDIEIERLKARLAGSHDEVIETQLRERERRLHDDFAFVAACNIGSEAMRAEDEQRLRRIAATTWLRHFDDRVGLSGNELARVATEPPVCLPATERLIADRPRDLVPRTDEDRLDPALGFKMDMPEHLYHHGELYNLSIRRGTLTPEERYKINEHMVHTITMLEGMPFPKHLKRVPEYAGTHHERMDGKGYPRRLSAEQLSVPSRIMAVVDVFEALTAPDRPYKTPKRLSEALGMLRSMAGNHLDADIVNLFITSGVFRDYATKHLTPDQIDVIDGTPYLAPIADAPMVNV